MSLIRSAVAVCRTNWALPWLHIELLLGVLPSPAPPTSPLAGGSGGGPLAAASTAPPLDRLGPTAAADTPAITAATVTEVGPTAAAAGITVAPATASNADFDLCTPSDAIAPPTDAVIDTEGVELRAGMDPTPDAVWVIDSEGMELCGDVDPDPDPYLDPIAGTSIPRLTWGVSLLGGAFD